ncbi:MAG: DUF1318 domain-containing protein [Desulfovibrionales bacterium]
MMKQLIRTVQVLAVMVMATACVTVNIYFPAAKVERTADQIVDDVYGQDNSGAKDQSSLLMRMAQWLGPRSVYAQDATSVSNSAIRGLKAQIADRHQQLVPFYNKGNVGIDRKGYLQVLNTDGLSLQEVATVKRLVQADNSNRQKLYREVASALNIDPGQIAKVEEIFAEKWREKAGSGWMVQSDDGKWVKN